MREHVLGSLDGLTDDDLRRARLPSGWCPLGLVNHLTVDVERFWFGAVVGADRATIDTFAQEADAWNVDPSSSTQGVLDAYRAECERSDAVLASRNLERPPEWWPEGLFGSWTLDTVGEVILHVVVETSCHAGHLDAWRELVDGKQWMVL